jgi:integrase
VVLSSRVDGVRRQQTITFRTKAAALAYEREHEPPEQPTRATVAEYIASWIAQRAALDPRTVMGYRSLLRNHVAPTIGHLPLAALLPHHAEALYHQMRTLPRRSRSKQPDAAPPPPVGERTVRRVHDLLSAALHAALRMGFIARNPLDRVDSPKPPKPETMSLSATEARGLPERLSGPYRLAALIALYTGLRRSELCGLRWGDIDGPLLTVRRKLGVLEHGVLHPGKPKTAASARTIVLPAVLLDALTPGEPEHYVLTNRAGPLHPDALTRAFRRVGLSLHQATRHTHASLLLAEGVPLVDVSARLGHADISITARTYAHVLAGRDHAVAEAIERALGGR